MKKSEKGGAATKETAGGECRALPEGQKFNAGRVVLTDQALDGLRPEDVRVALGRHLRGDWGDVCAEDWKENELGLAEGFRLHSSYRDRNGRKFWIITEWDRSLTTVLLPDDY